MKFVLYNLFGGSVNCPYICICYKGCGFSSASFFIDNY